jgi:enterochelin esterase-like enzyme
MLKCDAPWRATRRNPAVTGLLVVLAGAATCSLVPVSAGAQAGNDSPTYESPALQQLSQALRDRRPRALDEFWARTTGHVPLIEPIDGEDDLRWITFLWRGDLTTRDVSVGAGDIPTPDPRKWTFRRLGETDLWFKTDRVPKDVRFTYLLRVNGGPLQPDPLNDRRFGGRSVAESPQAAPQQWIVEHPDTPKGQLTQHALQSRILREERSIGVYTPPGYDPRGSRAALLILFDGEVYGNDADALVPTPLVLDNLIAAKRIPPTMAVLVNNMSQKARDRDLRCSSAFGDFIAEELLPWVRARYVVTNTPSQVVLAGSSDGGLAALCAAQQHPKALGNVLSQSTGAHPRITARPAFTV